MTVQPSQSNQTLRDQDSRWGLTARPVVIFESEAREIAGLSLSADRGCEIGGSLFGSQTPGGTTVIHLAVPHGPEAICRPAYFEDDPVHVRELDALVDYGFGLRWIGTHHLHPGNLSEPSSTDERQVQQSAQKNGRRTGLQVISNIIEPSMLQRRLWRFGMMHESVSLTFHFYYDALAGLHTRVPIRLLPGVSPVRQSLQNDPSPVQ